MVNPKLSKPSELSVGGLTYGTDRYLKLPQLAKLSQLSHPLALSFISHSLFSKILSCPDRLKPISRPSLLHYVQVPA